MRQFIPRRFLWLLPAWAVLLAWAFFPAAAQAHGVVSVQRNAIADASVFLRQPLAADCLQADNTARQQRCCRVATVAATAAGPAHNPGNASPAPVGIAVSAAWNARARPATAAAPGLIAAPPVHILFGNFRS